MSRRVVKMIELPLFKFPHEKVLKVTYNISELDNGKEKDGFPIIKS